MNKKELWLKIKHYHFNHIVPANMWEKINESFGGTDASTKAFADKISRKHNWTKAFALKAVQEYKKFIFLGVIGEFHVTPSKFIDVVWHEHILFTNAYNDFCKEIIEYRFEHYPELINLDTETEIYNAQYIKTLELYLSEFEKLPPADIWVVTKFEKEKIMMNFSNLKKKSQTENLYYSNNSYSNDYALYESFSSSEISEGSMIEFGGGDTGGAGASGSWSDACGSDASDGGDGGSDGGSGCSSGCGGGD